MTSPAQQQQYRLRYLQVCREALALLGTAEGTRWLRRHRGLASRSIAQLEQQWAREKHRRQTA